MKYTSSKMYVRHGISTFGLIARQCYYNNVTNYNNKRSCEYLNDDDHLLYPLSNVCYGDR